MRIIVVIVFCLGLLGCQHDFERFRDGDIIFQTSTSSQSQAIQAATHSKYSHMGIIYKQAGKYFVFEAIQPVKLTPLNDWIKRGKDGHYVVKRAFGDCNRKIGTKDLCSVTLSVAFNSDNLMNSNDSPSLFITLLLLL